MFRVSLVLHTDAEFSYHAFRNGLPDSVFARFLRRIFPAVLPAELVPKLRNLPVSGFKRTNPFKSDHPHSFSFLNHKFHSVASFYRNLYNQGKKYLDLMRMLSKLHGGQAVKTGECPGEALRSIVTVFVCQVNDSPLAAAASAFPPASFPGNVSRKYFQGRQIQPAVPQIFPDGIACHYLKTFLEIKWGEIYRACHVLCADVVKQMLLHVIDCRP